VACSSSFILRSLAAQPGIHPFAFTGVEISLNEKRLGLVALGGVLRAAFRAVNAKSTPFANGRVFRSALRRERFGPFP
jgi:hypothetical protein